MQERDSENEREGVRGRESGATLSHVAHRLTSFCSCVRESERRGTEDSLTVSW